MRSLLFFKLGVWAGLIAAAAFTRRAVPSLGSEESDDVALVAVFDGIDLANRSKAFRGGSMLAWFGGIAVDLREAELAPGARLTVRTLLGGVAIKTPPTWRVESKVNAFLGGVDTPRPDGGDPDAPVLVVDGIAILGGIAVGAKAGPARD